MKLIKRLSLIVLILIMGYSDYQAQSTPTCQGNINSGLPSWYTPDWDWLDANPANWIGATSTNSLFMASPFTSNTNTDDVLRIIDGLDYERSQGWTLLAKNFGVPGQSPTADGTAYFMLYNKYRGIVRLFFFSGNSNSGLNRASVVLKWSGINAPMANNSLLTISNQYAQANENYPKSNNAEKHVNYLNQVSYYGAWGVTEFVVHFDPNTQKNIGNFQYINFDFKLSSAATVSVSGDFEATTKSATTKNPPAPTTNPSNNNLLDYLVDGKEALAKLPAKSDIEEGFNTIADKVDDIDEKFCNNFTRDLHNANNSLQNGQLKDFLLGSLGFAEDLGGVIGTVAKVFDFFVTKSNSSAAANTETYIQPTVSQGTMKLSGTIVTENNPLSISLQLPGTSHKLANGKINCSNLPVYDCPLGVVSLQEVPTLDVRSWAEPVKQGGYQYSIDFYPNSSAGCSAPASAYNQHVIDTFLNGSKIYRRTSSCPLSYPTKNIKSYKVSGNVKLALNTSADVVIDHAKAALLFEIQKVNDTAAFNLFQSDAANLPSCFNPLSMLPNTCSFVFNASTPSPSSNNNEFFNVQSTHVTTTPFKNYAKDMLNTGDLALTLYDSIKGAHKFQTPFIDLDKFKNTAVTVEEGCNVYLKLLITMHSTKATDDQTPIVQVLTYEIPASKFVASNGSAPYILTCAQRLEEDTVVVGTDGAVGTVPAGNTDGFTIRSAFNGTTGINGTALTHLDAVSSIKLVPGFKASVQSQGKFRAWLNSGSMGCTTGSTALVVQAYTFACQNNGANNRFASFDTDPESERLTVGEKLQNLSLKIAPNPNNGVFKLIFSEVVSAGSLDILNSTGQVVYRENLNASLAEYDLDLSTYLTPGAYYLRWNNANFVINQKLIIN